MNTHLVLYQPGFPRHRTGNSLVVQLLRLGATVAIIYCGRPEGVLGGVSGLHYILEAKVSRVLMSVNERGSNRVYELVGEKDHK